MRPKKPLLREVPVQNLRYSINGPIQLILPFAGERDRETVASSNLRPKDFTKVSAHM